MRIGCLVIKILLTLLLVIYLFIYLFIHYYWLFIFNQQEILAIGVYDKVLKMEFLDFSLFLLLIQNKI